MSRARDGITAAYADSGRPQIGPSERSRIAELHGRRVSVANIARMLGVSEPGVRAVLDELGRDPAPAPVASPRPASGGKPLTMGPEARRLLDRLVSAGGGVIPTGENRDEADARRKLVQTLRAKLAEAGFEGLTIETVFDVGYRMHPAVAERVRVLLSRTGGDADGR